LTEPDRSQRSLSPDQLAAHEFVTELRTRIATQPLPYQYGIEAAALKSLYDLFALGRESMKKHPGCANFARLTTTMLNVKIRPVTAKWHRSMAVGILDSRDGANEFRAELAVLRGDLVLFAQQLQEMAYGGSETDPVADDVLSSQELAECLKKLAFGLEVEGGDQAIVKQIREAESSDVKKRRETLGITTPVGEDAVGLSLSGGGIRSATFCLGVVQVLASKKLLKDVDFLSTVSGGGYTGSFLTSVIGRGIDDAQIAFPEGPDPEAVRHIRQHAKYLSPSDVKQRWTMVVGTVAGLFLNWSVPLFFVALLAEIVVLLPAAPGSGWLPILATFLVIATLVGVIVYGFLLRATSDPAWWRRILAGIAALTVGVLVLVAVEWGFGKFDAFWKSHWQLSGSVLASIVAGPALTRFLPLFKTEKHRKLSLQITLYAGGAIVPLLLLGTFYVFRELGALESAPALHASHPLHYMSGVEWLTVVVVVTGLVAFFGLDVNKTGPQKLYRDQLAEAFMGWHSNVELPLATINPTGKAPYHLVNAAVNLPSSENRVLRDRRADFFLFSKHWSGSAAVGFKKSEEWTSSGKKMDLATAIAISGAAASPRMGLASYPTLSALMTLLNIRLGYWIKRPNGKVSADAPGFFCLLKEMTGFRMSESSTWLNVSDGGHIENMGLYELLRRRCKFIICVDGEADPQSTFQGQLTLVRHAQIDLGVRIEPRLDEMRPDPNTRLSRTHAQMFRVLYHNKSGTDPDIGLLLYMKLSLTGDEAELLKRYRLLNPDFPHQSTLDQFFDEEQFEAYRQLGVHVARGMFARAICPDTSPSSVRNWFAQLAKNMLEPRQR
jgi:hypothetical protein